MKYKLKLNENTTLDDIEHELEKLYSENVVEHPFDYIVKIAEFLGCELMKSPTGSQERFRHPLAGTFGNYFGVHLVHGKKVKTVNRANYKKYLYPTLKEIVKKMRINPIKD